MENNTIFNHLLSLTYKNPHHKFTNNTFHTFIPIDSTPLAKYLILFNMHSITINYYCLTPISFSLVKITKNIYLTNRAN